MLQEKRRSVGRCDSEITILLGQGLPNKGLDEHIIWKESCTDHEVCRLRHALGSGCTENLSTQRVLPPPLQHHLQGLDAHVALVVLAS